MPNQFKPSLGRPAIFPIGPSLAYIPLTRGMFARVDWDNALLLQQHLWQAVPWGTIPKWYAVRQVDGKQLSMHVAIVNPRPDKIVDHVSSKETLVNMRWNLREANPRQNAANAARRIDNASGFKGVHYKARLRKWIAQTNINGTRTHIGCFYTAEAAYAAYCVKAKELHGEFARLT